MNTWTFDITRQAAWDWWVLVCLVATAVLICYAVFGRPWERGVRGFIALGLIGVGALGTGIVMGVFRAAVVQGPGKLLSRIPVIGMGWTFALLGILSATFYIELIDRLKTPRAMVLLAIRIIALAMAVPMLFEPVLRYVTHRDPERPLLILVDTSGSMSFNDVQNGPTRIQSVWQTIEPQMEKIDAHFVPRFFTFATGFGELKKGQELAKVVADGKSTDIALGISKTIARATREDAAIAVFTDGIDNTSPDVLEAVRRARVPVHTLKVGSEQAVSANLVNIAVAEVVPDDEDFVVNHETNMKVRIRSTALPNRMVDVKMAEVDEKGKTIGEVATQKLILDSGPKAQEVKMPYTPKAVGVRRIAVWVDPVPGERSTVDNRQEYQGLAIDPRLKVAYIEGAVRPEYKVLNQLFLHDPNIEWATYLQLRVTGQTKAETHGTIDGKPFLTLPNSADGWRKIDVILIGDVSSGFFSRAQQEAIEQAVLNGSALLMIGGTNTLGPGGYQGTAIEKALPVQVGPKEMRQEMTQFIPRLTAEGAVHPAMEGLAEFFGTEETPGVKQLPPLRGNVVVAGAKTGATVLLVHKDRPGPNGKPQIVLAVQRYGKGRSAVFTGDTTNYWTLQMYGRGQDSPFNRFWAQLVRWLAGTDVRNRQKGGGVEGLLNKNIYALGENVRLRAMVRDELGYATKFAQVTLKLKNPETGAEQTFTLHAVENQLGLYEVTIPHPSHGDWTAALSATKDGKPLGKQELKFTVIPPAEEMFNLAANPALLAQIADVTRGTYREAADFSKLLDKLISDDRTPPDKETSINFCNITRALLTLSGREPGWRKEWDLPMQAGLVFMLLAVEWILRRVWQLP